MTSRHSAKREAPRARPARRSSGGTWSVPARIPLAIDGAEVVIPVKHGEGRYVADEATLDDLESGGQVLARYLDGNPNGSARDIAGIVNSSGTVAGLMPHPEHAIGTLTGPSADGLTSSLR